MQLLKTKNNYVLYVKSITWYKDSHSLFDYQSNKINTNAFNFPLNTKVVTIYRKRQSCQVTAINEMQESTIDLEECQFLTKFQIKPTKVNRIRLNFIAEQDKKQKKINKERLNTDESISTVNSRQQETYLIVRKQKDTTGQQKGYKLEAGHTIKLGRIQYFISQVCINGIVSTAKAAKERPYANRRIMKINQQNQEIEKEQAKACKICLEETEEKDNFLFNPCKCSGSCGTVHLQCLYQWIQFKVKKEVVGGTLHYNFQKFECEVCKTDLPMVIEKQNGIIKQLLPIEKPKGSYLILEAACEKTKSVMMIKNVPEVGIKLGRGHECEIRITDISVSRTHACIKHLNNAFYIFDNKSKFGTLVKEENLGIQIASKQAQGIQVGRTVITFDIRKEKEKEKQKEKQTKESQELLFQFQTQDKINSKKALERK